MPKFSKLPNVPLFIYKTKTEKLVIVPLTLYLRGSLCFSTSGYWVCVPADGIARIESTEATFFKFRMHAGQDIEAAQADPAAYATRINDRVEALITERPLSFRRGDKHLFEEILRCICITLGCARGEALTNPNGLIRACTNVEARRNPHGLGCPCLVMLFEEIPKIGVADRFLPEDVRTAVSMMMSEWFWPEGWIPDFTKHASTPYPVRIHIDLDPASITLDDRTMAQARLKNWAECARNDINERVIDAFLTAMRITVE